MHGGVPDHPLEARENLIAAPEPRARRGQRRGDPLRSRFLRRERDAVFGRPDAFPHGRDLHGQDERIAREVDRVRLHEVEGLHLRHHRRDDGVHDGGLPGRVQRLQAPRDQERELPRRHLPQRQVVEQRADARDGDVYWCYWCYRCYRCCLYWWYWYLYWS